jgi:hypothetical protein
LQEVCYVVLRKQAIVMQATMFCHRKKKFTRETKGTFTRAIFDELSPGRKRMRLRHNRVRLFWAFRMEQHALANLNNCLNTNILGLFTLWQLSL